MLLVPCGQESKDTHCKSVAFRTLITGGGGGGVGKARQNGGIPLTRNEHNVTVNVRHALLFQCVVHAMRK
jgi:hypothetical protein